MFSTRESAACGTHRSVVDTQHFDRIKCLAAEAGVAIQYKLNTLSPAQASCEHSPQLDRMKKICFVKSTKHLTWIAVFKGQWPSLQDCSSKAQPAWSAVKCTNSTTLLLLTWNGDTFFPPTMRAAECPSYSSLDRYFIMWQSCTWRKQMLHYQSGRQRCRCT